MEREGERDREIENDREGDKIRGKRSINVGYMEDIHVYIFLHF